MSLNNNKRFNDMDDLIRREDALNCFHSWIDTYGDLCSADEMEEYQAIEALPSVDIVHCKDCMYWDTDWTPTRADLGEHWCPMTDMIKPGDWFCADGERKVGNKSTERSKR